MSRPPAPSLRPQITLVRAVLSAFVLGWVLISIGSPDLAGTVIVVLAMVGVVAVVLSRAYGALPRRLQGPALGGLIVVAALGAFVL